MTVEVHKIKARDELIRIAEQEVGSPFSNLSDKQRSIEATKFYVKHIRNLIATSINDEDISYSVVDGSNDL